MKIVFMKCVFFFHKNTKLYKITDFYKVLSFYEGMILYEIKKVFLESFYKMTLYELFRKIVKFVFSFL